MDVLAATHDAAVKIIDSLASIEPACVLINAQIGGPLSEGMCCKTISTTELGNIDSRTDTSAQFRFKNPLNRIRILPSLPASSFATGRHLLVLSFTV
jgi:hypothetical protein